MNSRRYAVGAGTKTDENRHKPSLRPRFQTWPTLLMMFDITIGALARIAHYGRYKRHIVGRRETDDFGPRAIHTRGSPSPDKILAREDVLAHDRVHAPIAVDDLRHAEVDGDRHQADRLVLGELLRRHQEAPHLAERIAHRAVDGGFLEDIGLRGGAEVGKI